MAASYPSPVKIKRLDDFIVGIAAGHSFSLALNDKGKVFGWGRTLPGRLAVPRMMP